MKNCAAPSLDSPALLSSNSNAESLLVLNKQGFITDFNCHGYVCTQNPMSAIGMNCSEALSRIMASIHKESCQATQVGNLLNGSNALHEDRYRCQDTAPLYRIRVTPIQAGAVVSCLGLPASTAAGNSNDDYINRIKALKFLKLSVSDNGRGFGVNSHNGRHGIKGVRELGTQVSGLMAIDSIPALGTQVVLEFTEKFEKRYA